MKMEDLKSFIISYDLEKNSEDRNTIVVIYYALTTLSSVGFGDYAPKNTAEWAGCTFLFLIVVFVWPSIVGALMGAFELCDQIFTDHNPDE